MHPEILSFGPITISSYGLMLSIGFLFGITFAAYRAKKMGEDPDHVYNLSIWIVLSSLFGARFYYVVTHYSEFRADESLSFLSRVFVEFKNMFWPVGQDGQVGINGLVLYGGLIAATAATIIYLRRHKLKVLKFMDILGPSLGLGEFFTRIGCFLNGCCYGKPTEAWCGVIFPDNSAAGFYYPGVHIHPSQIYNSFAGLVIFISLIILERWKKFDGFTALMYFALYSIGRFSIDYTRYYESRLTFWGLSHNQVLSLIVFTVSLTLIVVLQHRAGKKGTLPEL